MAQERTLLSLPDRGENDISLFDKLSGGSPAEGKNYNFVLEHLRNIFSAASLQGYTTFATLSEAQTALDVGELTDRQGIKITNDPTDENNGFWHVDSGTLVQDLPAPATEATEAAAAANAAANDAQIAANTATDAAGDAQAAVNSVESALSESLSQTDVNPNFVSYDIGVEPDSTGATSGVIGAYFTNNGNFQKVRWSGTEWIDIGLPIFTGFRMDNISQLQGVGSLLPGMTIELLGYSDIDDGGGGALYWDPNLPKSNHNGGKFFDPTWANGVFGDPQDDNWHHPDPSASGNGIWVRETDNETVKAIWFGLVDDFDIALRSGTDNTNAIQAAINYAANDNYNIVTIPKGAYKITNLYFHYDSINNPGYPQTAGQQGRISLRGWGRITQTDALFDNWNGTVLYSNSSLGEAALFADGNTTGSPVSAQNFSIHSMSIVVNNTTMAIKAVGAPQYSGCIDVFVLQEGAGGGSEWVDIYNVKFDGFWALGKGKAVSTGRGFYLHNVSVGGAGNAKLTGVAANGFADCIVLGHDEDETSGTSLTTLVADNLQCGRDAGRALVLAEGLQYAKISAFMEDSDLGLKVYRNARGIDIIGHQGNNTKGAEFGDASGGVKSDIRNITYTGMLQGDGAAGIVDIFNTSRSRNIIFNNPVLVGNGTNTGFNVQNSSFDNLVILNPSYTNVGTEITNKNRVTYFSGVNNKIFSNQDVPTSLHTAEFIQPSNNATAPPIKLEGNNNSVGFMTLKTDTSPVDTNYNNVNERNGDGAVVGPQAAGTQHGWAFRMMVQIEMDTGDGQETVYIPVFVPDTV